MPDDQTYEQRKYRSRKFLLAVASFAAVTIMAGYGVFGLASDASGVALVIGSWGTVDGAILGLYNYANLKAAG